MERIQESPVDIDSLVSAEDIMGQELTITVTLHSASDLPEKLCRHPQARQPI